jgi:hypothetical protein
LKQEIETYLACLLRTTLWCHEHAVAAANHHQLIIAIAIINITTAATAPWSSQIHPDHPKDVASVAEGSSNTSRPSTSRTRRGDTET